MELMDVAPEPPQAPSGAWLCPKDDPYPKGAPLITSIPDDDSPLAYNEDEIVSLWTQIYRIFIKMGYLNDSDVIFPPEDTGRHAGIDRARFQRKVNMSDRVISLIQRLPYPADESGMTTFFSEGTALSYLNQNEGLFNVCRDPHPMLWHDSDGQTPIRDYLLPDDVALLYPFPNQGMAWILDTRANTIRTLAGLVEHECRTIPDDFVNERPDDEHHYRNWPAFHAPFILKQYIWDLWNLRFVTALPREVLADTEHDAEGALIAHTLRRDYGWPDAFRREAWMEDFERIRAAAWKWRETMVERWSDHKEIMEQWKKNPDQIPHLLTWDPDDETLKHAQAARESHRAQDVAKWHHILLGKWLWQWLHWV